MVVFAAICATAFMRMGPNGVATPFASNHPPRFAPVGRALSPSAHRGASDGSTWLFKKELPPPRFDLSCFRRQLPGFPPGSCCPRSLLLNLFVESLLARPPSVSHGFRLTKRVPVYVSSGLDFGPRFFGSFLPPSVCRMFFFARSASPQANFRPHWACLPSLVFLGMPLLFSPTASLPTGTLHSASNRSLLFFF